MKLYCPVCKLLLQKVDSASELEQWMDCPDYSPHIMIDFINNKLTKYSLFINGFVMNSLLNSNLTTIYLEKRNVEISRFNYIELQIDEAGHIKIPEILLKHDKLKAFL